MPEKLSGGFLPGSDPETAKANMAYQQALQKMQEALDARQNRLLDPELLALAQGFLAPTQTGGFGESLGYAAKNIREAQLQSEKEEREMAQARLGLASQGLELERLKGRERLARGMFGPILGTESGALPTGGAPTGGALPGTTGGPLTTLAGAEQAPSGFLPSQGVQTMPPNSEALLRRNQFIQASYAKGTDPADILKELIEMDKNRFQKTESAIHDTYLGKTYYTGTTPITKQVYVPIMNEAGEVVGHKTPRIDMLPWQAAKLDELAGKGSYEYYEFLDTIRKAPPTKKPTDQGQPSKVGQEAKAESAGAPKAAGRPEVRGELRSAEEIAAETEGAKESAVLKERRMDKYVTDWYNKENEASEMQNSYRIIRGIFDPKNPYASVLSAKFEKGTLAAQFGKLIESGLVGDSLAKSVRDIATQAGLPDGAITQLQLFATEASKIKLGQSSLIKGEGQVSDAERRLITETAISEKDNLQTILAKTEYLLARARFAEQRGAALREWLETGRGNYEQFRRSKDYATLKNNFESDIKNILENRLKIKLPERQGPYRNNAGAASRLPPSVRD